MNSITNPMATGISNRVGLSRGQVSGLSFIRMALDPFVAVVTYAGVLTLRGEPLLGKDLILCLIVFSLMFPGDTRLSAKREGVFKEIIASWAVVVGILVLFGWATTYLRAFSQDVLVMWAITVPFILYSTHRLLPILAPRVLEKEGYRTAIVVGASDLGQKLGDRFRQNSMLGVKFAGYFEDRSTKRLNAEVLPDIRGRIEDVPDYVKRHNVGAIFIALPMALQPRIKQLLESLYDTTASVYFVPDIFVFDLIQARVDDVDGLAVVAVCETPFYGINSVVKRLEDLILGWLILVLIAPLLVAIAIGVKMSSPGPILFRQRRYGLDGKEIIVYKFRSMRVMEDGAHIRQAQKDDPRVTKLGAFLRKSSLDELPQFINVVQGRMSIVGPRPHAIAHNEMYRKLIRGYMIRHKVKPGITGLAQINGFRGETETIEKMKGRVDYDLDYLRRWSLKLDLHIILKTFIVVVTGRNAY
ncbi:MAG: undecaprenyl-phosphate glucose phosphotransferase [Burkholderiales bacterium]